MQRSLCSRVNVCLFLLIACLSSLMQCSPTQSSETKAELNKLLDKLVARLDDKTKDKSTAREVKTQVKVTGEMRADAACAAGQILELTASSGTIQSPGFLAWKYPGDSHCHWRLTAPRGQTVQLSFSAFTLESAAGCVYASLSVFDGNSANTRLLGKYCGPNAPPPVKSTAQFIFIEFVSDALDGDGGFELKWVFVGSATATTITTLIESAAIDPCVAGGVAGVAGTSGTVQLPVSGAGEYSINAACRWKITVPTGQVVRLTFTKLDIEQTEDCEYDSLSVYNGADDKAPLLGSYCGQLLPQELIQSTGNAVFLKFLSDSSDVASGFVLQWTAVSATSVATPSNSNCGNPVIAPNISLARIVGGTQAVKNSWPWQCNILLQFYGSWMQWCGGSVLNNKYILTAAHCMYNSDSLQRFPDKDFKVICGEHNQKDAIDSTHQVSLVTLVTTHEQYVPTLKDYDIAVFQLATPLTFNDYVQPICLPRDSVPAGLKCVVTGWGDTRGTGDDSVLQQVAVPIVTQTQCSQKSYYGSKITNNMLCAGYAEGGKDACQGDSGGPLVCLVNNRWWQHGVVSFGTGCADPKKPGVYARVTAFLKWIQDKTGVTP